MESQLTLSAGVAPVLTTSQPAAAARHYSAAVGVPGWLAGPTMHKHNINKIQNQSWTLQV